jgi:hypothetical protein
MFGNHMMHQTALLNLYLVDKQNNFATKIINNINQIVSKSSSKQSVYFNLVPPPNAARGDAGTPTS